MKVGIGYDTHSLAKDKNLIIGGVLIPNEMGFIAHSDGDVLTHAIIDSILGAAGYRDIGYFFPDNDPKYKGINSLELLQKVIHKINKNYKIINIDSVIICQKPKLSKYIDEMKYRLENITKSSVNVKATTTEWMNDEGKGLCISSQAVSLLEEK